MDPISTNPENDPASPPESAVASVVVPAHNEERVIGRLLDALLAGARPGEFDVVVVCNGCTDRTAEVAAGYAPRVKVVETPIPSKHEAMRLGDEHAGGFPRLYVDADVELGSSDVRALAAALQDDGAFAAAPERTAPMAGASWAVRRYYDVWLRLPTVREGLFGRGAIAISEAGHKRIDRLPALMADDLAASLAFEPGERTVVAGAHVVVRPPLTWRDLMRRRVRAMTSTAQLEAAGVLPDATARTSVHDLLSLVRSSPKLAPSVAVFLAAAVIARRRAKHAVATGDFTTWLRDESSRA